MDNVQDSIKKNRRSDKRGENNGRHKLVKNDIVSIRADLRTNCAIAKEYNISDTAISRIRRKKSWGHII